MGKKNKQKPVDDFDDIIAESRAANERIATTATNATNSNSSSSSNAAEAKVPEDTIIEACIAGDITKLRRWAKLSVRVFSARPLCHAASVGKIHVVLLGQGVGR
jgi:hypothetical protein